MGGKRMNDKLQQIRNILASHFGLTDENEDGTYLYHLTRSKEAFSYGTMTLDDFVEVDEEFLDEVFESIKPIIEELQQENEKLRKQLSMLCPIADLPVIESLLAEKQMYMEQIKEYEDALREIDVHIRATPEPVPYIIDTLKKVLPEYE
jgi:predicted  nucleic acid-binding Zn-ribbon protein